MGEDVEFQFGGAIGVMTSLRRIPTAAGRADHELVVTNDHARRIDFEATRAFADIRTRARLGARGEAPLWHVTVPANGRALLRFSAPTGVD